MSASEWGTFDLVHARFLLEHIPGPESVVAQMARAVRPGGRVVIIDDDHGDFRPWPEPENFSILWRAYVGTFERQGSDPFVGRKLMALMAGAGLSLVRNNAVFFGGCAGDDKFVATADNLISAFQGARDAMLADDALDPISFDAGIEGLIDWKNDPSAALWYSACLAEATRPM